MRRRYPLPRLWLLTDERQGEALWPALDSLPRGSGVIFRHYSLDDTVRRVMFTTIRRISRKRRIVLLLAGSESLARKWHADGVYGEALGRQRRKLIHAASVHDLKEIRRAERKGADMLLLSPLFPTRSHPGLKALGTARFAVLARSTARPVIALGGVESKHSPLLDRIGVYGRAGIDAFVRKVKTA